MKVHDLTTTFPYINTKTSGNGPPTTTVSQVGIRDYVSKSAIVKGNFRDPNPHSYITVRTVWPQVGCTVRQWYPLSSYPNGPVYGTRAISGIETGMSSWYYRIEYAEPWGSDLRPTRLYNSALERMYDRLRGGLDLSIALGESGTTARMFKSVTRWDDFVRSLPPVRSRRDLYYFFPKLIGNSWLQFQYGWKPLISDVFNAAEEARFVITKNMTVTGSATEHYDNTYARTFPFNEEPRQGNYSRKGRQVCRIKCTYTIPDKSFRLDRWTSLNPLSIAWELMPYSFVVDWFLDVGSYMRSLETSLLYQSQFKSGYWSWLSAYDTTVTFGNFGYTSSSGNGRVEYLHHRRRIATENYRNFQRYRLLSSPTPRRPRFEAQLGWQRLFSSAALLAQKLGRA